MPVLGLGTYADPSERDQISQAVYDAITLGYRHIDTAFMYGVENQVGDGVRRAINDGLVTRSEMFIVTKIWMTNMSRDKLIEQAKESVAAIGLDGYVDCLLVHCPCPLKGPPMFLAKTENPAPFDVDVDIHQETWPAMEEVLQMGLTKSIGVSNYNSRQIEELMRVAKVVPVTNQVESTPFLPQKKLIDVCRRHGIVITAFSPFGGPQSFETDHRVSLLQHPTIKEIADKHGKNISQVLLRFHIDRGLSVIPKSTTKERIKGNAAIWDFQLTQEEIASLESLSNGSRICAPAQLRGHPNWPWDEE